MKIQSHFDNLFDKYNQGKIDKVLEILIQIDLDNNPKSPARTWAYKTLGEIYFLKNQVDLARINLEKAYESYEDSISYMEYIFFPELVTLFLYCLRVENNIEKEEEIIKETEIDFLASEELGDFYKKYYKILLATSIEEKQELLRDALNLFRIDSSYKLIIEEFLDAYHENINEGYLYIQRLPYYYNMISDDDF
ncbi:tetratricopeptide repeat protein [Clostridium cellulovorans]|nr:hypothetical protein [Clostridium cellulovorans]